MSTEHQQFSLENQAAAIQQYADLHGFAVLRTYSDAGRSGLRLKNRPALSQLLKDVVGGLHDYQAVLVYDVSRWGRFQDCDEAAHYEFLCKSNGIPIHYCAEPFVNDNSLPNVFFKTLKRTLAAEYSRELSVRVGLTLRKLAERGCWMGSTPGYGFRRMMVLPDGSHNRILKPGDQKSVSAATVTLVLGPQREVETVRSIYQMLLEKHLRPSDIVEELRRRGITRAGRPWSFFAVKQVLTNPKYAGDAVWGRTEVKLRAAPVRVPRERWIVKPAAFPQIVSMQTFVRAQKVYYDRTDQKTEGQLLNALRRLWKKRGYLREDLIDASIDTPSVNTYRRRFGSLSEALRLVRYSRSKGHTRQLAHRSRQRFARLRRQLARRLVAMFPGRVIPGHYDGYLRLPQADLDVAINTCPINTVRGYPIWSFTPRGNHGSGSRVALICLLNRSNGGVRAYYVVPRIKKGNRCRIYANSELLADGQRLRSLREFYQAALDANEKVTSSECIWKPQVLSGVPQIARYLRQGPSVIRRWIREGMPIYRYDRFLRASAGDVSQWVQRNGKPYVPERDKFGRFLARKREPGAGPVSALVNTAM